jgi:hypothetical protein
MDTLQQALQELNKRLKDGEEFADVSYELALKYRVPYSSLLRSFDQAKPRQEVAL